MYNAWQPGVFALSGWDLVGALPLERKQVAALIADGDTRWIHRGAYDLLGFQPDATESTSKMPKAPALYGSLAEQLADESSFASQLRAILAARARHGLATAQQLDIPAVSNKGMLVMVHRLAESDQVTVLNFANTTVSGSVRSDHLRPGSTVIDMITSAPVGEVDDLHSLYVVLQPHEGRSLLVVPPVD
jgi:trehalose synthase